MQSSPLVSVCIPVYNAENTLHRCLNSVIGQTLSDIEIIVVDDGSTDTSDEIIREYCSRDARIRYLSKTNNEGVSMARKTAVQEARSEYIGFVDSDDWVAPEMMEKLYQEAKRTQSDITVCNYCEVGGSKRSKKKLKLKKDAFSKVHPSFFIFPKGVNPSFCNKLFRRKLFFEKGFTFARVSRGEDLIETAQLYFFAQRIGMVDEVLYYYNVSELAEKRRLRVTEFLSEELKCVEVLSDFFTSRNRQQELKKFFAMRQGVLYIYAEDVIFSGSEEDRELLNRLITKYCGSSSVRYQKVIFFIMKLKKLLKGYIPSEVFIVAKKLSIYLNQKLSF